MVDLGNVEPYRKCGGKADSCIGVVLGLSGMKQSKCGILDMVSFIFEAGFGK